MERFTEGYPILWAMTAKDARHVFSVNYNLLGAKRSLNITVFLRNLHCLKAVRKGQRASFKFQVPANAMRVARILTCRIKTSSDARKCIAHGKREEKRIIKIISFVLPGLIIYNSRYVLYNFNLHKL